jgi:hypothetical protein
MIGHGLRILIDLTAISVFNDTSMCSNLSNKMHVPILTHVTLVYWGYKNDTEIAEDSVEYVSLCYQSNPMHSSMPGHRILLIA